MQALETKSLSATNFRPARIKAFCVRGSTMFHYSPKLPSHGEEAHIAAADALVAKFVAEDVKRYGSDEKTNPWKAARKCGQLKSGNYAHVFCW